MAAKKRRKKVVEEEEVEEAVAEQEDPTVTEIKRRVAEALADPLIQMRHPYEVVSRVHSAIDAAMAEPEETESEEEPKDELQEV